MSKRMSNEYAHDLSEKAEDDAEILVDPEGVPPVRPDVPDPKGIPANEGGEG